MPLRTDQENMQAAAGTELGSRGPGVGPKMGRGVSRPVRAKGGRAREAEDVFSKPHGTARDESGCGGSPLPGLSKSTVPIERAWAGILGPDPPTLRKSLLEE